MKAGWELRRLGDLCAFDKTQGIHSNLPYVGLEHIESGTGQYLGNFEPTDVKSSTFKFNDSHVLYGRLRPYLNKVLLPDFEGHCSTEIFPIHIKPGLLREYLCHWLMSESVVESINATCTGARMPRADMNEVLNFNIPVPSEQRQHRIVTLLDEAFADIANAKANTEKNLENADALFASALAATFAAQDESWDEETIGQWVSSGLLAKPQDGNHGEIHPTKADYVETGVPFIMAADLVNGHVDTQNCRFISRVLSDNLRIGFAKTGDVLLTHKGTIGRVAILSTDLDYVMLTPQVTYYRSLDPSRLSPEFLYICLLRPQFQSMMNEIAGAGSTRAYIGITRQMDLKLAIPPLSQQIELSEMLRAVESETKKITTIYRQKLTALDDLKKSLLHQAFSGQL